MSRTYSPAQAAYIVARAALDTVRAEVTAAYPAHPGNDCDDATFDAYCDACADVDAAHRLAHYEHACMKAEAELVEWSTEIAAKVARTKAERDAIDLCRTQGMRRPDSRAKLIDLAMALAA